MGPPLVDIPKFPRERITKVDAATIERSLQAESNLAHHELFQTMNASLLQSLTSLLLAVAEKIKAGHYQYVTTDRGLELVPTQNHINSEVAKQAESSRVLVVQSYFASVIKPLLISPENSSAAVNCML